MKRKSLSRNRRSSQKKRHTHPHPRKTTRTAESLSRDQEARIRGLRAINRVRSGKSGTLTAAARAEGTSVKSIQRLLPGALLPSRRGGRLRVRATDRYSQLVEILTNSGPLIVTARGSRERELAGRHRAAYLGVLENKAPLSILRQFRGKTVGGRKLLTRPKRLIHLGHGGGVENLSPLYVSPEASA